MFAGLDKVLQVGSVVGGGLRANSESGAGQALGSLLDPLGGIGTAFAEGRPAEALPIVGGFLRANRMKEERKEVEAKERAAKIKEIENFSKSVYSSVPTSGVQGNSFKYGGKMPDGGLMPMGDMLSVEGPTHEGGGVPLSNGIEVEGGETIKDNFVYSDRISPTQAFIDALKGNGIKAKGSYADVSKAINKKKEKLDKMEVGRRYSNNTKDAMNEKYDFLLEGLAKDQELTKTVENITNEMKYGGKMAYGGPDPILDPFKRRPGFNFIKAGSIGEPAAFDTPILDPFANRDGFGVYQNEGLPESISRFLNSTPKSTASKTQSNSTGTPSTPTRREEGPTINTDFKGAIDRAKVNQALAPTDTPAVDLSKVGKVTPQDSPTYGTTSVPAKGQINNFLDDNFGGILGALQTGFNQGIINKMETNQTPQLARYPVYNYVDRSQAALNENDRAFRTISQTFEGGNQSRNTNRAAALATKLNADSQVRNQELAREDSFLRDFNSRLGQTSAVNANIQNQVEASNIDRRNSQKALTQRNIDNLTRSVIGDRTQKDLKKRDQLSAALIALRDGDRGTLERLLKDLDETYSTVGKLFN